MEEDTKMNLSEVNIQEVRVVPLNMRIWILVGIKGVEWPFMLVSRTAATLKVLV